jgi:hypothetical protein
MRKKGSTKSSQFPDDHREVLLKLPDLDECCTPAETAFWQVTLGMALNGKTPREVAEFAAQGLDDPMLSRAYPQIREALSKWARMGDTWAPWDRPEESDHLSTIPKAKDMGFAKSEALAPLRSSFRSSGAGEDWFKRNSAKILAMKQHDRAPVEASFATVLEDIRALPETTFERTRLMPPPAV